MSSTKSLIAGLGCYIGDVNLPDQSWAVVVRSDIPSGVIKNVDVSKTLRHAGVIAAFTGGDIDVSGAIPSRYPSPIDLTPYFQPPIATEIVRYVGEPIAIVVAEDPYIAEDARDLILVEYEDAEPESDIEGLPLFAQHWIEGEVRYAGSIVAGFGTVERNDADTVVSAEFKLNRHTGVPLETRGLIAAYRRQEETLTVWGTTKVPLANRRMLAQLLGLAEDSIRFIDTDIGGGFGVRGEFYPEDFLIPWLSKRLQRPVKWIEDRREHLIATNHARDQIHKGEMGVQRDGTFVWLKDEIVSDMGAYARTNGLLALMHTMKGLTGPYQWTGYEARAHVVFTNKTPVGVYRAPGYTEATTVRESLIDKAAAAIGMDPYEIRIANLIGLSEMPVVVSMGEDVGSVMFDGGSFASIVREVAARHYAAPRSSDDDGRKIRTEGCSAFTLETGAGFWESAHISLGLDGTFDVVAGSADVGQGAHDVLALIASKELGVTPDVVTVHLGDSALVREGVGSFGSRTAIMAGSAVQRACARLKDVAVNLVSAVDGYEIEFHDGSFFPVDQGKAPLSWVQLAHLAADQGKLDELRCEFRYENDRSTFGFGLVKVWAQIDTESGAIWCERLVLAYDVGRVIDRARLEGQLIGGAVQGLGGALLEELVYAGADDPLFSGFMEYLLPTCEIVPPIELAVIEGQAADNPLGARGAGEAGTPGVAAAMINALHRAIRDMPDQVIQLPLTPEIVRRSLRSGVRI